MDVRSASSARRGTPGQNSSGCAPATRTSRWPTPRVTRRPGCARRACTPAWWPGIRTWSSRSSTPSGPPIAIWSSSGCRTRRAWPWSQRWRGGSAASSISRRPSASGTPRCTPPGTASPTTSTTLLAEAVYGLPELHRDALRGARLVATPGCHVTAATLALAPLVRTGLIATSGVVVNSITGVSGAGRAPKHTNSFLHGRRGRERLRLARSPPHPGDRAGGRRPGAVHPPPRADEPRHPGHVLRHAHVGGRAAPPTTVLEAAPPGLRRRAVHRGLGGPRRPPRRRSAATPPISPPATTSAPAPCW